jgi:fibronectin-binding autotransporter adhesin
LIFNRSGANTVTNVISGTGTVTKAAGSGTLTLSGANTFNGNVFSSGGTLIATSVSDTVGSGLGLGSRVELGGSSAELQMNIAAGTTNTTLRQLVVTTNFTFANYQNGSIVWNGNLVNNATSAVSMAFNGTSTATNVFGGTIANSTNGSVLNLTLNNTGNWSLTGTNTFSGGVTISDGKLIVSSLATNGSIGSGNFRMGGFANVPVLEYVGSGDTNNKQMRLGAGPAATGGRILANGTGALVFTNANFISGADVLTAGLNRAVIFGGTNTADNAITGVIANVNPTNTVSIVKEDAGKWILSGSNTYTGSTTVNDGTLVIMRTNLTATIRSNSVTVAFSSVPSAGTTYSILPGALAGNSLGGILPVEGLGIGQTATVVNDPNLVVQVTGGPTNPTFEDAYPSIDPLAVNPANGLTYLMNYALGGTGPTSNPALPVLTSDGTSLTLTANIRDSGQGVDVVGEYTYDLAGDWTEVVLTPHMGASSSVANTTVQSFTQNVEAGRPKKFMRFKATKNP